jgi:SAM-dependent methyltransferase
MTGPNTSWYEDESFWHTWGPLMFSKKRVANTPVEIDQILALLNVPRGAQILDLCCGVGRHSLELARRGFKVTGVDRTQEYLNQATEQAAKEGLQIKFVQADMRNFCQPDAFDLVINLFTSFGYFEDPNADQKVLNNTYSSLKPGGLILMDLSSKEILARIFRERVWSEVDGVFWLEEHRILNSWSHIENRWILFKEGRRYEDKLILRLYSAAELLTRLQTAGFTKLSAYGGFDGSPYDNNAKRLVAVGYKD